MANTEFKNVFLAIDTPLDGAKKKFFLRSFSGVEQMSRLFEFQMDLVSPDANINFDQIVGKNVTVSLLAPNGSPRRFFNGFISRFSQSPSDNEGGHYQAALVPWLWFLTRTTDCLIFQDQTVPDIVKAVSKRHGFETFLDVQLNPTVYRKWEYSVQYRETAANYIMRLMEQEGIFFFFRHEKGSHKMVMGDHPAHNKPCSVESSFRFAPRTASGQGAQEETISSWQFTNEIRTGKYSLKDFNFQDSSTSLLVTEPSKITQGGNDKFETYDYPGEYETRNEGTDYTKARMEEEEVPHTVVTGTSNCLPLTPGFRFTVSQSERKEQDGAYLLTQVSHSAFEGVGLSGEGSRDYTNGFECIPKAVPFRPARTTPRPLMQGSQTATVVAKQGEEILVDKFGRVKVRFHWDRETNRKKADGSEEPIPDEERSCFIRVSQPWAGTNWGAIWIPRKGQEVIVDFLEGDPDQPIITGRVYNDKNMPPYTLPDNQTQSGFKSRSSKEGTSKNFNEIRFEDKKGREDLLIHAERTMHNSVENSQFITVGVDRHIKTGYTDEDGETHGDVKELVHNDHNLHVLADQRTKIEGASHAHVQKDADAIYDKGLVVKVGQKCVILADTIQLQGTQKIVLTAGESSIVIDSGGVTVLGTPAINLNSPGAPPPPEMPPMTVDPDDPS